MATHFMPDLAPASNLGLMRTENAIMQGRSSTSSVAVEISPISRRLTTTSAIRYSRSLRLRARRAPLSKLPSDSHLPIRMRVCNYSSGADTSRRSWSTLELCDRLLAKHPELHEAAASCARGTQARRCRTSWVDYEARKLARRQLCSARLWFADGEESRSTAKTVLVYAEQGSAIS
jgi:hypothetical protein